eukprot:g2012.t1
MSSSSSSRMRKFTVVTTTDDEKVSGSMRTIMKKNIPKEETIESVYEWKGKVERDKEIRLTWNDLDEDELHKLTNEIERMHNYDVPMILTIPPEEGSDSRFLKGQFRDGSFELAASLVKRKLVGCAQMRSDSVVDLKTTQSARDAIEKSMEQEIHWEPISANSEYLKWLDSVVDTSTTTTKDKEEEL